jgi:hypothetical protein
MHALKRDLLVHEFKPAELNLISKGLEERMRQQALDAKREIKPY